MIFTIFKKFVGPLASVISIAFSFFAFATTARDHKPIQTSKKAKVQTILATPYKKQVPYHFSISDKLKGCGKVDLSISNNKIVGYAKGLGDTKRCMVDLETNFKGTLDLKSGNVNVDLSGVADPIIFIPGVVSFKGPVTGSFEDGALKLMGLVEIDGALAGSGGFNKTEEVLIEIADDILYKNFLAVQKGL